MTDDTQAAVAAALTQAAERGSIVARSIVRQCLPGHNFQIEDEMGRAIYDAILALIPADAMAALEAVKAEARREAEKEILQAAGDEYTLEHPSEGPEERMGRHSTVRGMMVRLGLYDKLEAAIDAAMEGKP